MIILDDPRFSIVLYNLISNGVKHTNGGHIKVSVKLLNQQQLDMKKEKI
jgi:signal transduction histidine kinase